MEQNKITEWIEKVIQSVQKKENFYQLRHYSDSLLEAESLESIEELLSSYKEVSQSNIDKYIHAKIQTAPLESEDYECILSQSLEEKRASLSKLVFTKSLEAALRDCYKEKSLHSMNESGFLLNEVKGSECIYIQYFDIKEVIQSVQKKEFFSQLQRYSDSLLEKESLESIKAVLSSYSAIPEFSIDRYMRAKIKTSPNEKKAYEPIFSQHLEQRRASLFKLVFTKSLETALTGCYKEQFLNCLNEYEFLSSLIKEIEREFNYIQYFHIVTLLHEVRLQLMFEKLTEGMQKALKEKFQGGSILLKAINDELSSDPMLNQSMQADKLAWSALIQDIIADKELLQNISDTQIDICQQILYFRFGDVREKEGAVILEELHAQLNAVDKPLQDISEYEFFASLTKKIKRECNHIQYFEIVSFLHEICLHVMFERLPQAMQKELEDESQGKPVFLKAINDKLGSYPSLNRLVQSDKLAWNALIQDITADKALIQEILNTPLNIAEAAFYLVLQDREENSAETLKKLRDYLARFFESSRKLTGDVIEAYVEQKNSDGSVESSYGTESEDDLDSGYRASPDI